MLKLYGINLSVPVLRVKLCVNALGIECENILARPGPETQTEEYLAMHPAGKVPAINDDGYMLFESNAIIKYLCRKHNSDFYPDAFEQQAKVDQWADFTTAHLGSGFGRVLFNKVFAELFGREKDERSLKDGYAFINRFMPILDAQLGQSDYIASDKLSIADFSLLATLDPAEVVEVDVAAYPNINKWRQQLMQESFYQNIHASYGTTLEQVRQMIAEG